MRHSNNDRLRSLLFFLTAVLLFGAIVLLKRGLGDKTAPASAGAPAGEAPVVRPDTSVAAEVRDIIAAPDSVVAAPADSLGRDRRPAGEAGAEDGYWDGYHDGVDGAAADGGDSGIRFPTSAERAAYADSYTDNYHRGYREGRRVAADGGGHAAASDR